MHLTERLFARSSTASTVCHFFFTCTSQKLTEQTVDVPMSRVKFNVNTEYAYIQNFKILQSKSAHLQFYKSH